MFPGLRSHSRYAARANATTADDSSVLFSSTLDRDSPPCTHLTPVALTQTVGVIISSAFKDFASPTSSRRGSIAVVASCAAKQPLFTGTNRRLHWLSAMPASRCERKRGWHAIYCADTASFVNSSASLHVVSSSRSSSGLPAPSRSARNSFSRRSPAGVHSRMFARLCFTHSS
jgi:hypothetical protein